MKNFVLAFFALGLFVIVYNNFIKSDAANIDARPLANVLVPANISAKSLIGKKSFDENCADCHGLNAAGKDGFAPPLIHIIYEPSHHGDIAFQLAARNGVKSHHWPFGNMPPIPDVTQDEVNNIIHYVRELQRANGIH